MTQEISHAALALLVIVAAAAMAEESPAKKPPTVAEKITYYQQQVTEHPQHYPAYALLGRVWLERARSTYDPTALAKARQVLQKSIDIQPNYEALCELAATANYSHHFKEALGWCRQAADAAPQDKSILAMKVEALLALGRTEEAHAAIGDFELPATDFYIAASRAQWFVTQGELLSAVDNFQVAAKLAQQQQAKELAAWATVSAAGVWLDRGKLEAARPLLHAAVQIDADDPFVRIHQAEMATAEKKPEVALQIYQGLLKHQPDPELHRRAFNLCGTLGRKEEAESHRAVAEKLCRRAVDAGELYGLETLAQLYCDVGRYGDALPLAEQNLKHKNDAAAHATLARARQVYSP